MDKVFLEMSIDLVKRNANDLGIEDSKGLSIFTDRFSQTVIYALEFYYNALNRFKQILKKKQESGLVSENHINAAIDLQKQYDRVIDNINDIIASNEFKRLKMSENVSAIDNLCKIYPKILIWINRTGITSDELLREKEKPYCDVCSKRNIDISLKLYTDSLKQPLAQLFLRPPP